VLSPMTITSLATVKTAVLAEPAIIIYIFFTTT
jgi:hypothetical protein